MEIWSKLSKAQVGRYGEYLFQMALVSFGYDVFSSEVDDKGIDFVLRIDGEKPQYHDIQVKTARIKNNWVFMKKSKFPIRKNNHLGLVRLIENEPPNLFVIPSMTWRESNALIGMREYTDKKSEPEYGLRLSKKNLHLMEPFRLTENSFS